MSEGKGRPVRARSCAVDGGMTRAQERGAYILRYDRHKHRKGADWRHVKSFFVAAWLHMCTMYPLRASALLNCCTRAGATELARGAAAGVCAVRGMG